MSQSKQIKAFTETVCQQIKSKKARGFVTSELLAHIEDQKLAYMKNGLSEDIAETQAIIQMGNPVTVGEDLNKIHCHERDWIGLILNIIMWTVAGIVAAFGIFCGAAAIYSDSGGIGIIIGLGFIASVIIVDATIISVFKLISHMLFSYSLLSDFKKRKKRGELYGKH